jgi:hypothetical protein
MTVRHFITSYFASSHTRKWVSLAGVKCNGDVREFYQSEQGLATQEKLFIQESFQKSVTQVAFHMVFDQQHRYNEKC